MVEPAEVDDLSGKPHLHRVNSKILKHETTPTMVTLDRLAAPNTIYAGPS